MELIRSKIDSKFEHFNVCLEIKKLSDKEIMEELCDASIEILENRAKIHFVHFDVKMNLRRTGEILFNALDRMTDNLTKGNAINDRRLGDHYSFTNNVGTTSILFAGVSLGLDSSFFLPKIQAMNGYKYASKNINSKSFEIISLDDQREDESRFFDFHEFIFSERVDLLMPQFQLKELVMQSGRAGFYSEIVHGENLMFGKTYFGFEELARNDNKCLLVYIDEYQSKTVTFFAPDLTNLKSHWKTPEDRLRSA